MALMALVAYNIFLFFAPWQNWGKASRRTAFCQGRVGQSISKIYLDTWLLWFGWTWWMFHEGKMRDKEEAKKLTEKAHFASMTDLKCFRSCRLIHYKRTWWTDHLTIQHLPLDISLKHLSVETSHISHHQAHELVESLWRSGIETVILGTGLPGGLLAVCCLCLKSQHSIFPKCLVVPCCSIHLTSFDKKIPFELLSYLGWSFRQRG